MLRLLTVFTVIILCGILGCGENVKKTGNKLSVIDSLGWQEDANYNFGGLVYTEISDNELFVADPSACDIRVYDLNSMKFKRKFGVKGHGPGEFNFMGPFTISGNGDVVVPDPSSMMIAVFDKSGKYKETIKTDFPNTVKFLNDKMYVMEYSTKPQCCIKTIEDGNEEKVLELDSLFVQSKLETASRNYDYTCRGENEFAVLYFKGDRFFDLKTRKEIKFPDDGNAKYFVAGSFIENGDSFYILQATMENPEAGMECETAKDYKVATGTKDFIYEYDYSGNLISTLKLPEDVLFFPQSLTVADGYVVAQDVYTGNLFKYKIM